ncbi:MAG: Ig-like domain-containing protein [Anaerolineae bacterium]
MNAPVSVTFSEPVTVTGTIAIDCATSGVQNATPTGGPTTFALPHTDFDPGESCTVTILASQVADQDGTPNNMAADYDWSFATAGGCFAGGTTPIHTIQGSGATSPLINTQVTVEALVVADFQGVGNINGYFVQMADSDQDGGPRYLRRLVHLRSRQSDAGGGRQFRARLRHCHRVPEPDPARHTDRGGSLRGRTDDGHAGQCGAALLRSGLS